MEAVSFVSQLVAMATQMGIMSPYEMLPVPLRPTETGPSQESPPILLIWSDHHFQTHTHLLAPAEKSFTWLPHTSQPSCLN